jgi:methylated-DNA-[protein]-cysteine S-methyltransferase
MEPLFYTTLETPVGPLLLAGTTERIRLVRFPEGRSAFPPEPGWAPNRAPFREAVRQLRAYFEGRLRRFDLPLEPRGTPFQQRVWGELRKIPYGRTVSYGELAARIGRPTACRAVGAANGRNPLPILVPCHRVVGARGELTGFGGGLPLKAALLRLERAHGPA